MSSFWSSSHFDNHCNTWCRSETMCEGQRENPTRRRARLLRVPGLGAGPWCRALGYGRAFATTAHHLTSNLAVRGGCCCFARHHHHHRGCTWESLPSSWSRQNRASFQRNSRGPASAARAERQEAATAAAKDRPSHQSGSVFMFSPFIRVCIIHVHTGLVYQLEPPTRRILLYCSDESLFTRHPLIGARSFRIPLAEKRHQRGHALCAALWFFVAFTVRCKDTVFNQYYQLSTKRQMSLNYFRFLDMID
jgi:hypothetical protein